MNRRQFTTGVALTTAYFALGAPPFVGKTKRPQLAITMDDFNWNKSLRLDPDQCNDAILSALSSHKLKAALFVAGKYADNEKGQSLLRKWDDAGHIISNHSYSHSHFHSNKITAAGFNEDILKAEAILKGLPRFEKRFRFPFLKEGNTVEKRDGVRRFLKQHGYRNGHVTIDASDWAVDERLTSRLKKEPSANAKPYGSFYLDHMFERATYYDDLAQKLLNRRVKHTMLIHHNLLNALFLKDLLDMFVRKGWELIDAADAFEDPVFSAEPNIVPAGESLIWALAKETGRFEKVLRYPGEDSKYETPRMDELGL